MKSTPEEAFEAASESGKKAPSPKFAAVASIRHAGAVSERDRTVTLSLHRGNRVELSCVNGGMNGYLIGRGIPFRGLFGLDARFNKIRAT